MDMEGELSIMAPAGGGAGAYDNLPGGPYG